MEIRHTIEIAAPLETVYGRCRQVEDLPALFPALLEVTPEEPNGIRYRVVVGSNTDSSFVFQVEITELSVDRVLAWRHLDGPLESGSITFSREAPDRTRLAFSAVPRAEMDGPGVERVLRRVATQLAVDLPRSFVTADAHVSKPTNARRALASAAVASGALLLFLASVAGAASLPLVPAPDAGVDAARMLEAARVPSCVGPEEALELHRYHELIANAESVEEAREKAVRPSRLARRAMAFAGLIRRDDAEIDRVRAQLADYEARVTRAETPQAAAAEFDGLVRVAGGASVKVGGGGCSYDTPEIIAIVFGFLLFIIPGIILLIVFC